MCWVTKKQCELKIAEGDIPVIKIMREDLRSVYECFLYELGKKYTTELGPVLESLCIGAPQEDFYVIHKGFHSYSVGCIISTEIVSDSFLACAKKFTTVEYNRELLDFLPDVIEVNCIIPKGSKYYVNERGEYVSDSIEIINIK